MQYGSYSPVGWVGECGRVLSFVDGNQHQGLFAGSQSSFEEWVSLTFKPIEFYFERNMENSFTFFPIHFSGHLKIAEIESRFDNVNAFIGNLKALGFDLISKDVSTKVFYFLSFKKSRNVTDSRQLRDFSLKPCLYKKRWINILLDGVYDQIVLIKKMVHFGFYLINIEFFWILFRNQMANRKLFCEIWIFWVIHWFMSNFKQ